TLRVPAFCDLLDELPAEGGNIVRLAARDDAAIGDYFLVDPLRPGVDQVGLERRPRGHGAAFHGARLDQRPWAVADHADRLSALHELPHELDRLRIAAQLVGVRHSAGQQQCVVIVRIRRVDSDVDVEPVALVEVMPALHFALGGRHDLGLRAGVGQRLARPGHLDLLETFGNKNGNAFSIKRHGVSPRQTVNAPRDGATLSEQDLFYLPAAAFATRSRVSFTCATDTGAALFPHAARRYVARSATSWSVSFQPKA